MINELLDNAFKFSEKGDVIKVVLTENEMAKLYIYNEGIGIAPDNLKSIKAFMQFNKEVYDPKGMGLGLSIASKIIELYDGRFSIHSQQNAETQVIVSLPLET